MRERASRHDAGFSTGYGILPEIDDDEPPKPLKPHQTSYSLKTLGIDHAPNFRDAALLAGRVTAEPELPLAPWVAEFERLRRRMRNLEDHLDYHAKWQNAVVMYGPFFAARNRIVDRVRELRRLQEKNGSSKRIAELQQRILTDLSPFRPTSGLHVETRTGGERVLPVRLHTDITDVAFLELFRDAVESEFSRSEAARSRRFAVDLSWEQVPPERLYPEGPPARGATIDVDRHRERFPMRALVLTTGAESTHAWQGRSVLLGSAPVTRRTLAHEFGHLLGFDDAYVRGFDGDPRGAYGVVLVEWSGLKDDLMGNPGTGRVTEAMIDQLIEAYGDP